ncbi:MAG TPA: hypothetical protein VIV60_01650, partial [Polyangiaceae bacterium]
LFSSFGADRRVLIAAFIVAVASLDLGSQAGREAKVVLALAGTLIAARLIVLGINWHRAQHIYDRVAGAFEPITAGSRVACLVAEPNYPFLRNPPLEHFCTLAVVKRDVFINSLFAEKGKQILRVKYNEDTDFSRSESHGYRYEESPSGDGLVHGVLARLPTQRFDWVLLVHAGRFAEKPGPGLERVWRNEAEDTSLFRVR